MADPELVDILRQGSKIWNNWRMEYAAILNVDLQNANLYGINLKNAPGKITSTLSTL